MSFKEQLIKAATTNYHKKKKQNEQKHEIWQQQNMQLIEKIKSELLNVAGMGTSDTYATIDIRELNLSTADISELEYYFLQKEDIIVFPNEHLSTDKTSIQAPYTSLGFNWGA